LEEDCACPTCLDGVAVSVDNPDMSSELATPIPAELLAEMQEAAERAANGVRDPERMRQACERMDCIREEIRREHGVLDIGVPALRELRDAE
jgi:hypothetical protein